MVLNTQLQLKWPNHSSHLLTGLKALFQNELLVDCTLKCNKHCLKVHRSVLAACSPYFERELENNPSVVVKDVQFNVLQALIEFMYYGETRISEDNLTSLIEAAKLFEVKGLSEMDLLTSNENSIVLSVVAMNGNGVKSSSDRVENLVFETNTQPVQLDTSYKNAQQLPNTISPEDSEDSNSNLIESKNSPEAHSCRDFVVTPTESAQILLSLSGSFDKELLQRQIASIQPDTSCDVLPTTVLNQTFVIDSTTLTNGMTPDTSVNSINDVMNEQLPDSKTCTAADDKVTVVNESELYLKYNGNSNKLDPENNKSLLAELLTRTSTTQSQPKNLQYYKNVKGLYECEVLAETTKNQNVADTSKVNNFALQTDAAILEYPFLVETTDGLVDAVDMLNVFDNGEVFDPSTGCKATIKLEIEEDVDNSTKVKSIVDNHELEHIKLNTEDELKDDPEAVVLCKVNEHGEVEKYVLSSADINALRLKLERRNSFDVVETPHIEVELPTSDNKSLITRIFSADEIVDKAISKLPFKRVSSTTTGGRKSPENDVENVHTNSSSSSSSERLMDDTPITVEAHHHENMFEELDNQFSMDCSIENIQREYGAYEEASKNETQLEHNYYANALKDEDEECAVVISGENYDLHPVMYIQQPTDGDDNLVAVANNNNKDKSNANTSSSSSLASTFQIYNAEDLYVNYNERTPRHNGVIDKPTFNGKCDLILNRDELMNSMLSTVINNHSSATVSSGPALTTGTSTRTRATNCAMDATMTTIGVKSSRNAKTKRRNSVNDMMADGTLTLPFKKVKNAVKNNSTVEKQTYACRRRSTSLNECSKSNENLNINGGIYLQNVNLVEEVIVDEVL